VIEKHWGEPRNPPEHPKRPGSGVPPDPLPATTHPAAPMTEEECKHHGPDRPEKVFTAPTAVQQSQASGGELCCLTLPLNSLIAGVDGVTLIAREIKELIVWSRTRRNASSAGPKQS
jgi:hypothetical protein